MSVLVVLEQRGGRWTRLSLEAIAAARILAEALGTEAEAVAIGSNATVPITAKAFVVQHQLLSHYTADGYTEALEQLIRAKEPETILFPHSYQVRDYAPKLAARFHRPFISDVIEIQSDKKSVHFVRQLFQGKLNATVSSEGRPLFVSVQAGAFRASDVRETIEAEPFAVTLEPGQIRAEVSEPFREAVRSVDLSAADVIVAVGRGIKEKENISMVEELAQVLNAELAASRPLCDSGWLPMERQVGSSGQTVAPKMYLAVGISGAIQHLVGMKGSKTVVAINRDSSAPIFENADYGIAGDLFEVIPALVDELKRVKS